MTATEGDTGNASIGFTITRNGRSAGAVTVDYTINAPGTAGQAGSADFPSGIVFSGTLNFADGQASQTLMLPIAGDTLVEGNETFTVTL